MAKFIPVDGQVQPLDAPLTLTVLSRMVGGEIEFIELRTGDMMVIQKDSWFRLPINHTASVFAGLKPPVCGSAILCSPDEIA